MENFYLKYKDDIFRFTLSIVKNTYWAEEITQECFLRLMKNNSYIRDKSKIKCWLFTTARNISISALAKEKRMDTCDLFLDISQYDPGASVSSIRFFELISLLDDDEQQLISLRIIGRLRWKEISEVLNCPIETIKKRYQRLLAKIKKEIEE